jgi:aspartyl-tRNA(Asn)/glutamyl-tRNA(Gln) amidotransferase subunit A
VVRDLTWASIGEAAALVAHREVSPVELTAAAIARAEALDPIVNAFITRTFEMALAEAEVATAEITAGRHRGPLHGIPLTLKDNYETAGVRTTAGSRTREHHVPTADAHTVGRLKVAGAVLLGKVTLHERGMGGTNVNPAFGTPRNPWDLERITGGSSGGSAAAVATGMGFASLGSDSRGSVRIPAALCGITGLKPTYGRVSVRGIVPYCWSLDHAGTLTRNVEDAALVLQAIAGYDPLDPTSVDAPVPDCRASLTTDVRGLRIGLPGTYFFEQPDVDPEVAVTVRTATTVLAEQGASVVDLDFPDPSRYLDGGAFEAEAAVSCADELARSASLFGPDVRARLLRAQTVTAADYIRARRRQLDLRRELDQLFEHVDLILTPTCPVVAPRLADAVAAAAPSASLSRNTRVFNTAGLPTIAVPCGWSAGGLPIGLSLTARAWHEPTLLRAAHTYQSLTTWHTRHPPTPTPTPGTEAGAGGPGQGRSATMRR